MKLKKDKKLQDIRIKLWCDVAVAYVSTPNSLRKEYATDWADQVLKDFDERFKT